MGKHLQAEGSEGLQKKRWQSLTVLQLLFAA